MTPTEMLKTLDDLDAEWEKLASFLPEEQQAQLRQKKAEREKLHQEREALVKKCHPNDNHWPPHPDCPACQKIFQMLECQARKVLTEEEAKDEKKLEEKVWEIFEERYTKRKEDASKQG